MVALKERYDLIEESEGALNPLLLFAEGGTTNGTSIVNLKRGAFVEERRIRPYVIKYDPHQHISASYDCCDQGPLTILLMCWFGCHWIDMLQMPEFEPTDYLFEEHADQGTERWEIAAWAMREAMCKASGLERCDMPLRMKRKYEWYLTGDKRGDQSPRTIYDEYIKSLPTKSGMSVTTRQTQQVSSVPSDDIPVPIGDIELGMVDDKSKSIPAPMGDIDPKDED